MCEDYQWYGNGDEGDGGRGYMKWTEDRDVGDRGLEFRGRSCRTGRKGMYDWKNGRRTRRKGTEDWKEEEMFLIL